MFRQIRYIKFNKGLRQGPATALRTFYRLFIGAVLIHSMTACSISLPIGSLGKDDDVTGSIERPVSPLSSRLNEEDWRRAQAALALSVDPQGNGMMVSWDNPGSGMKGNFAPAGPFYLSDSRICRSFAASLIKSGLETRLEGICCRLGPNEWTVVDSRPVTKAE